jgi:hypothetical protein
MKTAEKFYFYCCIIFPGLLWMEKFIGQLNQNPESYQQGHSASFACLILPASIIISVQKQI